MKFIPLAVASLLVAMSSLAHAAPPTPGVGAPPAPGVAPPPSSSPDAAGPDAPPPPPGRAPPPPRGADIHFDRGPGSDVHLHVHCADADSTRICADVALELAGKLNVAVQAK